MRTLPKGTGISPGPHEGQGSRSFLLIIRAAVLEARGVEHLARGQRSVAQLELQWPAAATEQNLA